MEAAANNQEVPTKSESVKVGKPEYPDDNDDDEQSVMNDKPKSVYKPRDPMEVIDGPSVSEVLDLMKCGICGRYPVQEPYNCENGHSLCSECMGNRNSRLVAECWILMQPHLQRPFRCNGVVSKAQPGPLWKLYLRSTFRCPNLGCNGIFTGKEIGLHTKICSFRASVCCTVTGCPATGMIPLPLYMTHIQEVHPSQTIQLLDPKRPATCKVFLPSRGALLPILWICEILETFENKFIIMIKEGRDAFQIFGFIVGEPEDSDKFIIRFEVTPPQKKNLGVRWCGPVSSITTPLSEVEDSGSYFYLRKDLVFHNLIVDEDFWLLNVSIGVDESTRGDSSEINWNPFFGSC